jgi:ankyrin repeat protein
MTKKQRDRMLWEGCESGDFNKIRLAINFGADLEAKNKRGKTPLHWASYNDSIAIAKLLLERGADVEAKDKWGRTPLDFADDDEMEALLKKYIK